MRDIVDILFWNEEPLVNELPTINIFTARIIKDEMKPADSGFQRERLKG